MPRKNAAAAGAPWRRNSDESISISPRCVLDGYTTTTSSNITGSTGATASAAAYADDGDPSTSSPPKAPAAAPWKAVAEAWRSRAKRQLSGRIIPPLGLTMSSTLRRLSIRRPDHAGEVHEFCVMKPSLRTFSLAELKKATRNFHKENVVGKGGFAKVYRGNLPGGELVAVKRLTAARGAAERVERFLSELGHVVNVSHPNIARLVGVGVDGGEHLVFPFSPASAASPGCSTAASAVGRRRPWL